MPVLYTYVKRFPEGEHWLYDIQSNMNAHTEFSCSDVVGGISMATVPTRQPQMAMEDNISYKVYSAQMQGNICYGASEIGQPQMEKNVCYVVFKAAQPQKQDII